MENIYETVRISNYLQSLVQYGCFCYYSQKVHNVDVTISKRNSFSSALYFGWNFICSLVVSICHSSILGLKFSDNCKCLSPNSKVHFPVWVTLILVTLTSAFEFGYWNAIKWIVFTTPPPATFSTTWSKFFTQKYVSNVLLSAEGSNGRVDEMFVSFRAFTTWLVFLSLFCSRYVFLAYSQCQWLCVIRYTVQIHCQCEMCEC